MTKGYRRSCGMDVRTGAGTGRLGRVTLQKGLPDQREAQPVNLSGIRPGRCTAQRQVLLSPPESAARVGKAIAATGHKILAIAFQMLRTHTPYKELGDDYFDQLNPARATKRLVQRLQALGHQVQLSTALGSNP